MAKLKQFQNWVRGVGPGILVVEMEKRVHSQVDDEDAVRALASHPGFITLTNRLQAQRALLRAKHEKTRAKNLYESYNLQNGIQWLDYLNSEVNKAVFKKAEIQAVVPSFDERAEFDKVFALISGV